MPGATYPAWLPLVAREQDRRLVNWEIVFLILLTVAAFLLRLWGMSKVHFWDENVYLQNAEVICCGKTNYSELDSRPPLLSLIFAAVFLLWHSIYAVCIVTAALNAAGTALLYLSSRMFAGRLAASIGALLFAFCPFFVSAFPIGFVSDDIGTSLLADSPAVTLILLAFWLLLRALQRQTDLRFALAGLALSLCFLMRFGSASTICILSLLLLAAQRRGRAMAACSIGFALGLMPYFLWSRLYYGGFLATLRNGWGNFEGLSESPLYFLQNFGIIFSWLALAGVILWAASRIWMLVRKSSPLALKLEAFLLIWTVAVLFFFSAIAHKEPRYVMPIEPPLFLLAGIGLSILATGERRAGRVAGAVLLVCAFAYTFAPVTGRLRGRFVNTETSEELAVSEWLSRNASSGTVIYANFNYPDYGYYTNLPVRPVSGDGSDLLQALSRLPEDGILIAYKPSNQIAGPPPEWLDANPHYKRLQEFPLLTLYRYSAK